MARILVASIPVAGHINPLVPVVRALCGRGHDVAWYTGSKYRGRVDASGARWIGPTHARDYDDAYIDREYPERTKLHGLAKLKFDMKHVFMDNALAQLRDVQHIAAGFAPDVLLCEAGSLGGLFHSEQSGVPLAVLGVIPLARSSIDTAPFGLGLAPDASTLGHLRNRALNWAVEHVLFRDVQRYWNETRAKVGLPPNVRFIGMIPVDAPRDWTPPPFWHELDGSRPVVHVTQGTLANTTPQLIAPTLEGLAQEDVLVVVATGGPAPETLGLRDVPGNARVGTFFSYPALLPKTAVMITNGGYGGVQMALAHGVPLIVAGTSEDKPEVAVRVACAGAGLNLRTATPTPEQVRRAVRTLIDEPRFRARAQALAADYARYDAVKLAVDAVEGLAGAARAPR